MGSSHETRHWFHVNWITSGYCKSRWGHTCGNGILNMTRHPHFWKLCAVSLLWPLDTPHACACYFTNCPRPRVVPIFALHATTVNRNTCLVYNCDISIRNPVVHVTMATSYKLGTERLRTYRRPVAYISYWIYIFRHSIYSMASSNVFELFS